MSNRTETETHTIYLDDNDGNEIECEVTCEVTSYLEHGYGADADGNRGQDTWFVEDWKVTEVDGQDVESLDKKLIEEIEHKVAKHY